MWIVHLKSDFLTLLNISGDLFHRLVVNNATAIDERDGVANLLQFSQIVTRNNNRNAVIFGKVFEDVSYFDNAVRVKTIGWFVED